MLVQMALVFPKLILVSTIGWLDKLIGRCNGIFIYNFFFSFKKQLNWIIVEDFVGEGSSSSYFSLGNLT